MNRSLAFIAFVLLTFSISAQKVDVCKNIYNKYRTEGIDLYNKGNYMAAAKAFKSAHCLSLTPMQHLELDDWAKKCANGNNAARKRKPAAQKQKAIEEKPTIEIVYTGYLVSTCNGDERGTQLMIMLKGDHVKGKRFLTRCIIAPQSGSGKVLLSSPLASNYTVDGNRPGQEQTIQFKEDEECVPITFFVPFGVMDFRDDYTPQTLESEIYVYLSGETSAIAEDHKVYEEVSANTITVDGSTKDVYINADYDGGRLDLGIALCGNNKPEYKELPTWITYDGTNVRVGENTSSEARTATITVGSSAGGNTINIIINQKGKPEEQNASATINNVWLNETVRDANKNLKQLDIHIDCSISDASEQEVQIYVFFFCADGTTPLLNAEGEQIVISATTIPAYAQTQYDDFPLSMWLHDVTNATNNTEKEAKYYIFISTDNGQNWIAEDGPHTIAW